MLKQAEKAALAGLYIILVLGLSMAVLLSARTYSTAQALASSGAAARVADQYLRMKIRQGDALGAVAVGNDRISITEVYPEGVFTDAIYASGGMLMEQIAGKGVEIIESMGDPILPCDNFRAAWSGQGLEYGLARGDVLTSGYILTRGSGTGGPRP